MSMAESKGYSRTSWRAISGASAGVLLLATSLVVLTFGVPGDATVSPREISPAIAGAKGYALSINDFGEVAGYSKNASGSYDAFRWSQDRGFVTLPSLGGQVSFAAGIDDQGRIIGSSKTASGVAHAVIWSAQNEIIDLNIPGVSSQGQDINELGHVVGYRLTSANEWKAFLWTPETGAVDLGALGGLHSVPFGMNNLDQVVGYSTTASGQWQPFFWDAGEMINLGSAGSAYGFASEINDAGNIVGGVKGANGVLVTTAWTVHGGTFELGAIGGLENAVSQANGINEQGDSAGRKLAATSDNGAFLQRRGDLASVLPPVNGASESVNAMRQLAGWSKSASGEIKAMVWLPSDVGANEWLAVVQKALNVAIIATALSDRDAEKAQRRLDKVKIALAAGHAQEAFAHARNLTTSVEKLLRKVNITASYGGVLLRATEGLETSLAGAARAASTDDASDDSDHADSDASHADNAAPADDAANADSDDADTDVPEPSTNDADSDASGDDDSSSDSNHDSDSP